MFPYRPKKHPGDDAINLGRFNGGDMAIRLQHQGGAPAYACISAIDDKGAVIQLRAVCLAPEEKRIVRLNLPCAAHISCFSSAPLGALSVTMRKIPSLLSILRKSFLQLRKKSKRKPDAAYQPWGGASNAIRPPANISLPDFYLVASSELDPEDAESILGAAPRAVLSPERFLQGEFDNTAPYTIWLAAGASLRKGGAALLLQTLERNRAATAACADYERIDETGTVKPPFALGQVDAISAFDIDFAGGLAAFRTSALLDTIKSQHIKNASPGALIALTAMSHGEAKIIRLAINCSRSVVSKEHHKSALPAHAIQPAFSKPPLVSIIIPTRDGFDLLKQAYETALANTHYEHKEIIIIDNGSTCPKTLSYFSFLQENANVKIIRIDEPFNFSRLINAGAAAADGDILLLLNNDIEGLSPEWINVLVAPLAREDVGACGSQLLYPDKTLQHGGVVLGAGGVCGHVGRGASQEDIMNSPLLNATRTVSAVTGACLATKKSAFHDIGGFDASFAVECGDIDYCLRLAQAGLRTVYEPGAVLIHHESSTRGLNEAAAPNILAERRMFASRWRDILGRDPFYSLCASLEDESGAYSSRRAKLAAAAVMKDLIRA